MGTSLGGGLIFGGAYTWRGLFSEFYSNVKFGVRVEKNSLNLHKQNQQQQKNESNLKQPRSAKRRK